MAIDWTPIFKKYKGKWVALKNDEKSVIAVGNSAQKAINEAVDKGYKRPILLKVPTTAIPYIGSNEVQI